MKLRTRSEILANKSFLCLFIAQVSNSLAAFIDFTALMTLVVYQVGGAEVAIALVMTAYAAPGFIVSPIAGAIAERFRYKPVMLWSSIASTVLALALATFSSSIASIVALTFLRGSARSFYSPSNIAAIRGVVGTEQMTQAFGLIETVMHMSKIVGPALGALLLLKISPASLFYVSAGLFAFSTLTILRWSEGSTRSEVKPSNFEDYSLVGTLRNGLHIITKRRILRSTILTLAITTFAVQMTDNLFGLLTKHISADPSYYSISVAVLGAGGVIGSIAAGGFIARTDSRRAYLISLVVDSLCFASFAALFLLSPGWPSAFLLWIFCAFMGAAIAIENVAFNTLLNDSVGAGEIALALGLTTSITSAAVLAGPYFGAVLVRVLGLSSAYLSSAMMIIIPAIIYCLKTRGSFTNENSIRPSSI